MKKTLLAICFVAMLSVTATNKVNRPKPVQNELSESLRGLESAMDSLANVLKHEKNINAGNASSVDGKLQ